MNMDVAAIDWRINYRAVFGPLAEDRAKTWWEFIAANLRGDALTVEDMNQAVAELCASWERPRAPTVRDLFFAVVKRRKESGGGAVWSHIRGGDEPEACALCSNGWLLVWPELGQEPGYVESAGAYSCMVPCRCSAGGRQMDRSADYRNMPEEQARRVEELRDLALRQNGAINREVAAWDCSKELSQGFSVDRMVSQVTAPLSRARDEYVGERKMAAIRRKHGGLLEYAGGSR